MFGPPPVVTFPAVVVDIGALRLTAVQRDLWDILADGAVHSSRSLVECLWDSDRPDAVHGHLSALRRKLRSTGLDVQYLTYRRADAPAGGGWRLVRALVPAPGDGRR